MEDEHSSRPRKKSSRQRYFSILAVMLVVVNVLTFLYHMTAAALFNGASNAVSIGLILYSLHIWLSSSRGFGSASQYLIVAGIFTSLSFVVNITTASPVDTIKYLAIYIVYAAGRVCPGRPSATETYCSYALVALPIAFMLTGASKVYPSESVAYLPNANTAALYFAAVLFALSPQLGNGTLALQFVNAALMNKVGAAVATIAALTIWLILPFRKGSLIAVLATVGVLGVVGLAAHTLGILDRLETAYSSVRLIVELEPATIAAMPYKELVELTGTKDLSAFFRVIHWANIWSLYSNGGLTTILFGYGAAQTKYLAYAPLPPHNDYLRVLAEYGVINLVIFVAFLLHVVGGIKLMQARVLFIVLIIYMFSENLIDNFTSMALYFAYAGRISVTNLVLVPRPRDVDIGERSPSLA